MKTKPAEIIGVMNLLNDPFIERFDDSDAMKKAEAELESVDAIEGSDITAVEKCAKLFELMGHKIEGVERQPLETLSLSGSESTTTDTSPRLF